MGKVKITSYFVLICFSANGNAKYISTSALQFVTATWYCPIFKSQTQRTFYKNILNSLVTVKENYYCGNGHFLVSCIKFHLLKVPMTRNFISSCSKELLK